MGSPQPAPQLIRKKKAPPALTNSYQKAHKSYVLASALFASWVLIGFGLDTKDRWGLEIKSPNGIPLVLLTMILYFGYRLTVEWMQCDEERRNMRVAKVDFFVAHGIAVVALSIGTIQYLSHIRIADYVSSSINSARFIVLLVCFVQFIFLASLIAAIVATRRRLSGRIVTKQIVRSPIFITQFALVLIGIPLALSPIHFWVAISYCGVNTMALKAILSESSKYSVWAAFGGN